MCDTFVAAEDVLYDRALQLLATADRRLIVGIAGVPGAGKTFITAKLVSRLNEYFDSEVAITLPMDGFHYPRAHLDTMPDPSHAYARRGAPFTFDAQAFVDTVACVQAECTACVPAPSFDHAVGDPVPQDIAIEPHHKLVFVEGLYILIDEEPWTGLRQYFDESWMLRVDIDTAMRNVVARQVGNGAAEQEVLARVQDNDCANAEVVIASAANATLVVDTTPAHRSLQGG